MGRQQQRHQKRQGQRLLYEVDDAIGNDGLNHPYIIDNPADELTGWMFGVEPTRLTENDRIEIVTDVRGHPQADLLEGIGAQLFARVDGDYFTILGLPLLPLLDFLREQGALPR